VGIFQFGEFELDCDRFELFRAGRSLKVERMPMELLILLVSKKGQLVSRAEIAERLWPDGVFVDTEHGTNSFIRKIRLVLRDDSGQPRFVQTVTGKGYRFIAPITRLGATPNGAVDVSDSFRRYEPSRTDSHSTISETANQRAAPPLAGVLTPAEQNIETGSRANLKKRFQIAALATAAAVAAGLVIGVWLHRRSASASTVHPQIRSLAVLPLDNLSGDPGQQYFADGMTDELTTMLAKNSTLRIVSRTSAMQFKDPQQPLRDVARLLGVDGIVEGSISRAEGKVHMSVQLIQASTDTHLWADSYDRDNNDVAAIPAEAAQAIAKRVNASEAVIRPERYVNPEAHDAYLRGRYYWFSFHGKEHGKEAAEYFRKAIALQPDYALGWVGLSDYYGVAAVMGNMPPAEADPQAEYTARKALQLDDSLADAHISMAWVCLMRYDWSCVDAESARSVALNPESAATHHCRAWMLIALNRMDEAVSERKKAMDIDPYSWPWVLVQTLDQNREFDAAIKEARMRLGANPTNAALHITLSESYLHKGMEREAAEELETSLTLDNDRTEAAAVRQAFGRGGYPAVLYMQLDELKRQSKKEYVSPLTFAFDFGELHRKEETLRYLEKAYQERSPGLAWLQHRPEFDFLHDDKRYQTIVRRVGLSPTF
jgi:TolB-like protein/DNA-binding winged helix-turn-helix (wHTH) protein/Tfp pilus assembly protein PilF